jgi:hypothetical protein
MTGLVLALAAAPLRAHHAFSAEFDVTKPLTLKGTLSKWEMINPHSWFHIDVKEPDGKVTEWLIEGGSPNTLIRLGVTKHREDWYGADHRGLSSQGSDEQGGR